MKPNDKVTWTWGNGSAEGKVAEVRHDRTEITSKGQKIVRNGTSDNPALIIEQESGDRVLKLQSEVQKAS
jgi:hypothetical protein